MLSRAQQNFIIHSSFKIRSHESMINTLQLNFLNSFCFCFHFESKILIADGSSTNCDYHHSHDIINDNVTQMKSDQTCALKLSLLRSH
ncbi:CLUMA_CG011138, isoform A [Clunio marinus]|uniref:CLUMA_CG011138, isoform A n=1 Tax=Clunio marinus TaxID=568069 RepID=A0A1J1IFH8_9DIPT|nr:CLUMA_CG011138, isoform A [Clunio marinus]